METLLNAYTGTYHHYREESQRHQTASHNLFFVFGSLARQSTKCAHNVHLFCLSYRAVSDTRVVAVLPIGAFFRGEIMIIIKMIPPFRPWRYCTFCLFHPPAGWMSLLLWEISSPPCGSVRVLRSYSPLVVLLFATRMMRPS